jgi:hypothetical protein
MSALSFHLETASQYTTGLNKLTEPNRRNFRLFSRILTIPSFPSCSSRIVTLAFASLTCKTQIVITISGDLLHKTFPDPQWRERLGDPLLGTPARKAERAEEEIQRWFHLCIFIHQNGFRHTVSSWNSASYLLSHPAADQSDEGRLLCWHRKSRLWYRVPWQHSLSTVVYKNRHFLPLSFCFLPCCLISTSHITS